MIYLITYGSKLVAFHPQKTGIGKVEDLGGIYDDPSRPPHSYYAPNLAVGENEKLYYFLGGHGQYARGEPRMLLMEMDPRTKQKRAVLSFPTSVISEVTGKNVKDGQGIPWRGFHIGTVAASEDGRHIVLGEEESLSQLLVFPVD